MGIVFYMLFSSLFLEIHTHTHTHQTISTVTTGEADGLGVEVLEMVQKGL